jgi:hypothetical protein
MVTALAAGQGITSLLIDLSRTHATNPIWPGHARFHVVWQTFELTLVNALAIGLIWWSGPAARERFYLAAILTALPMASFFIALFARKLYGGTLHDPNGVRPVPVHIGGKLFEVDMNAALVIVGLVVLVIAVFIF